MTRILLGWLRLPKEVTAFEVEYLGNTHLIALVFLAFHVPALTLIALLNGTDASLAILLSTPWPS